MDAMLLMGILVAVMALVTIFTINVKHRPRRHEPTRFYGFTVTGGEPVGHYDHRENWEALSAALKNRLYDPR